MEGNWKIEKVTVKLQIKATQQILRERNLEEKGMAQKYIDSEVIRLMAPYTPKDKGSLIDSATDLTTLGSGEVKQGGFKAPYAIKWYYTPANFTGSPMRGTKWFERMKNNGGAKSIFEGLIRMTGAKK